MRALLAAQFDMMAQLSETLSMKEDEAVAHAKAIVNRLLDAAYRAASHVIKPKAHPRRPCPPSRLFPPTRRGTPKRKRWSI